MPRSMLVPKKLALLVTLSEAAAALVIAPAELSTRLPAVLAPESCVALSSVTSTAPAVFTVNEPKFTVPAAGMLIAPPPDAVNEALPPTLSTSVALFASVMLVPEKLAALAIVWLVPALFVIEPVELSAKLLAVLVPDSTVAESSAMFTAPAEL